jgi:hypothetical protein
MGHIPMLYHPQGLPLQTAELLQQILEAKALIRLDLVQQRGRRPVKIERADDLGLFSGGRMLPVVGPNIHGRGARIVAPATLDVLFMG